MNELSIAPGRSSQVGLRSDNSVNFLAPRPIPTEWQDVDYRQGVVEATVSNLIAWQVRVNREERGMKQADLAAAMGTQQSAISRLEDTEGGDVMVSTLLKAAHAFDCALLVRFVSHDSFAAVTANVHPDHLFAAPFKTAEPAPKAKPKRRTRIAHGNS